MPVTAKPNRKNVRKAQMQDSVQNKKRKYVRKVKPADAKKFVKKLEKKDSKEKIKKAIEKPKRKYTKRAKATSDFAKKFQKFLAPDGIAVKFVNVLNELAIEFKKL